MKAKDTTEKPSQVKKETLSELSRRRPTKEEFDILSPGIENLDDRAAALVVASLIESSLEFAIKDRFVTLNNDEIKAFFGSFNPLLGSFSSKTNVAHAIGLISREMKRQIDLVRTIRNAFAHSMAPIDFNYPAIKDECDKFDASVLGLEEPKETGPAKRRYIVTGLILGAYVNDMVTGKTVQRLSPIAIKPLFEKKDADGLGASA